MNLKTLDPKADFVADAKRSGEHQDLMAEPRLREAIKIALLSYAMKLGGDGADGQQLATTGLRLEGAKGFIRELFNLGLAVKVNTNQSEDELDRV